MKRNADGGGIRYSRDNAIYAGRHEEYERRSGLDGLNEDIYAMATITT